MVVAISCGPVAGCWYFLEAVGHHGTAHAKSATNDPPGRTELRTFEYRGTMRHTFLAPKVAIPNVACSYFPPHPPV